MAPYNVPHADAYSMPSSPLTSDTASNHSNHSNESKKVKYDSNYENMIFRAGYTNMQNEYIYNHQRRHALRIQDDRLSITSTTSSAFSSMDGYRSTPSPDFALSLSQTSSPLFMGYQQTPADLPPLRYFQQPTEIQSPVSLKASTEHNYAVDSPNRSTTAPELLTPEPDRIPARARILSDSGHSTIPEPEEINPLCMNDWFRNAVRPEFTDTLQLALTKIETKSAQQKEQYLEMRISELPTDLEYNPNKSRLRKVYESPAEAAERERNNLASRKSRFKKKIAQQITNMHLEFDRNENSDLYAMQNWMGQVIFELESLCLNSGLMSECLLELRRQCGFSQSQLDKL